MRIFDAMRITDVLQSLFLADKKRFTTMSNDGKTLFDYWQESMDEMWKRALDEDSDEEELGTFGCRDFSCGGFRKREGRLDHQLKSTLEYYLDGSILNELGAMFDGILFELTPEEEKTKKKKKRNRSRSDHENLSPPKEDAAFTSTSHKNHSSDGKTSLTQSSSIRRNSSLRSNSSNFRSSDDLTRSLSFRRPVSLRRNTGSLQSSEERLRDAFMSRLG